MDSNQLKTHLHQLLDETNDVQLLTDLVEQIEETKNGVDWWDTLSEGRQQRILQPEEQYKNGGVVSNENVLEKSGNGCKNSLEYCLSEPVVTNDAHCIGAFLHAAVEREKIVKRTN